MIKIKRLAGLSRRQRAVGFLSGKNLLSLDLSAADIYNVFKKMLQTDFFLKKMSVWCCVGSVFEVELISAGAADMLLTDQGVCVAGKFFCRRAAAN